MNQHDLVKSLVSQFEQQAKGLPTDVVEKILSGKLEIKITEAVGAEAGGLTLSGTSKTDSYRRPGTLSGGTLPPR